MRKIHVTIIASMILGWSTPMYGQGPNTQIASLEKPSKNKVQKGPLSIGDTISFDHLSFYSVRNVPGGKINLSDYKGKLIILDFWNRWCTSCIGYFPKMEKIQQEFGDKVQVLLVTNDSYQDVKFLFDQSTIVKSTKLPFILSDTSLNSLFPHKWVPYHIWINEDGIVRASTNSSNTTIENIRKYLETGKTDFIMRTDYMDYDSKQPLLMEGNGRQLSQVSAYSMFFTRIKGTQSGGVSTLRDTITNNSIGIKITNSTIKALYAYAYLNENYYKRIIESSNPDKFDEPKNPNDRERWHQDNFVSYELLYPPHIAKLSDNDPQKKEYKIRKMRNDLDGHFPIISRIETREIKCYTLYWASEKGDIISKGGSPSQDPLSGGIWEFKNTPFKAIPAYIKIEAGIEDPIFDETGLSDTLVDMKIKLKWKDIDSLKKELAQYGIGMREEAKMLKCLVLKEIE